MINADVENAILNHYGIKRQDEHQVEMPKMCHICDMPNAPDSKICSKCGKHLDLKTILEDEEKKEAEKQNLKDQLENLKDNMENMIAEKMNQYSSKFVKDLEKMMEVALRQRTLHIPVEVHGTNNGQCIMV